MKDIVTGKRWWSHGYIPEENAIDSPPVLYWFKLVRKPGGEVEFVPHLINNDSGVGTQIVVTDMNGELPASKMAGVYRLQTKMALALEAPHPQEFVFAIRASSTKQKITTEGFTTVPITYLGAF